VHVHSVIMRETRTAGKFEISIGDL
jgi:hypothetical protein